MSLKSFHIIFICISTLSSIFFGYWCYNEWSQIGDIQYIIYSLISVAFTIAMLIYGKWFLKEISELNAS
jgi:ABC-type thiamin/hydroxymethylpyrimidine transport system permease subunit